MQRSGWLIAVWLGSACSAPKVDSIEPSPTGSPASPQLDATPTASAATTIASSAAPSAPPAQPLPPPEREGAAGSTKASISCGKTRCLTPGQACFLVASEWKCRSVPAIGAEQALASSEDIGVRCDDGLDCPDGETCCMLFGYGHQTCVPRGDVSSVCQSEICVEGGARCPSGRTCTAKGSAEGRCVAPDPQATCAGKRRCSKDKPICAIIKGAATCVAKGSPEYESVPGSARYQCTRQEDCSAGDTCYFSFGEVEFEAETFCGSYSRAYMGSLVCDTTAPSPCKKGDKECEELNQCRGAENLKSSLPWLGAL